jgi:CRISPR-associated protein Csb2
VPPATLDAQERRDVLRVFGHMGELRIGLHRPRELVKALVSAHLGVPPAHVFPQLVRKDGGERRHAHAILVFEQRVVGPVLIGAGRYRGYGVYRPVEAE